MFQISSKIVRMYSFRCEKIKYFSEVHDVGVIIYITYVDASSAIEFIFILCNFGYGTIKYA